MDFLDSVKPKVDSFLEKVKSGYYYFEDKYYNFLDKIDEKIPVYKVIDPIDKIVPSFMILIVFLAIILLVGIFSVVGIITGLSNAKFVVTSETGSVLSAVPVIVIYDGKEYTFETDDFGEFIAQLSSKEVEVKVLAEGYEEYTKTMSISFEGINEIILEKEKPKFLTKLIEIRDENNDPINGADIRFSCSKNIGVPNSKINANNKETVSFSAECGVLSAIVTKAGYIDNKKSLSSNSTIFLMKLEKLLEGKLRISIADEDSGEPVPGIALKLYTQKNIWKKPGQTDSSGVNVFTSEPGMYYVKAIDERDEPKYGSFETPLIEIIAGEEESYEIEMKKLPPQYDVPGIKLKFVEGTAELKDVEVSLFEESAFMTKKNSGSDGTIIFSNMDENKAYSVVAKKQGYVLKVVENLIVVGLSDGNSTVVELEKATEFNSGKVTVKVIDYSSDPVKSASVRLYFEDHNFFIDSDSSSNEGAVIFENLPFGSYYAEAEKSESEGKSAVKELSSTNKEILLEVTLILKNGSIEAEVVDTLGRVVQGARVEFIDSIRGKLLELPTNMQGKTEKAEFKINLRPYLVVSHIDYLNSVTQSFELSTKTKKVKIVMHDKDEDLPSLKCDSSGKICMNLVSILTDAGTSASSLKAGNAYRFLFDVKIKEKLSDVDSVVRTGLQENLTASDSIIVIESISSPGFADLKFASYDSDDDYAESDLTNLDAKQANIYAGQLEPAVYSFEVKTFIKATAEENAVIEIRYGARDTVEGIRLPSNGLFLESFILGEPLFCDPLRADCDNFVFEATLSEKPVEGKDALHLQAPVELDSFVSQKIYQDVDYELDVVIFNQNQSKENFTDVDFNIISTNGAVEVTPDSFVINEFLHGTTVSADFSTLAQFPSASSLLNLILGLAEEDNNVSFEFSIPDKNDMIIVVSPTNLAPNVSNNIILTLSDAGSGELLEDAVVVWDDSPDFSSPEQFIELDYFGAGIYSANISARDEGEKVYITAQRYFYNNASAEVIAKTTVVEPPEDDFSCLSVSTETLSLAKGSNTIFSINSDACESDVEIAMFIPAASQSIPFGFAGPLTLRAEETLVNQCVDCSSIILEATDSIDINVSADRLIGHYDIYLKAKTDSTPQFSDFALVEITVTAVDTDLFSINNPIFNIANSSQNGIILNNSYVFVPDFWQPQVNFELESSGKYLALQPRFEDVDNGTYTICWTISANGVDNNVATPSPDSNSLPINIVEQGCSDPIVPDDDEVYSIGKLSQAGIDALLDIDPTQDFLEITVEDDTELFSTWIEGTVDSNIFVKSEFVGNIVDYDGIIDFEVINQGFHGRDYALLKVTDYATLENVPDVNEFDFNYKIIASSGTEKLEYSLDANVAADGEEYLLGKISELISDSNGSGNVDLNFVANFYSIDEQEELVVVYFKDQFGRPIIRATSEDTEVFARTAFDIASAKNLDVGIVIDTSGSMDDEWATVCTRKDEILETLRGQGFDVNAHVYGMAGNRKCTTSATGWGDEEIPYNGSTDSLDEAWAANAQDVIAKYPWKENSRKIIIVIGDNAPSGRENDAGDGHWRVGKEELIVENLVEKALAQDISLFFLHPSHMESRILNKLEDGSPRAGFMWDDSANDSVELMDWAAEMTGGSSDVYENGDVSVSGVSRFVLLILKATYPVREQYFHTRIDSGTANVCYGRDGIEGITGEEAVPRIFQSWNWSDISLDLCDLADFETGAFNKDFVYCDATQFTTELMHKISRLKNDIEQESNFTTSEKLLNFSAYLMSDGYNEDFMNDFYTYRVYQSFEDTGSDFLNEGDGLKKLFEDNQLVFSSKDHSVEPLPAPGLYDVSIEIKFGSAGDWIFSTADGLNFDINVVLTLVEELDSENLIYRLPINGRIGAKADDSSVVERNGYGTGFEGDFYTLGLYGGDIFTETRISGSEGNPLMNLLLETDNSIYSINRESRGNILNMLRTTPEEIEFTFSPSEPNPVLLTLNSTNGSAEAFYAIMNDTESEDISGIESISLWSKLSSNLTQCKGFDGNRFFAESPDVVLANYPNSTCYTENENSSYGFVWDNAQNGQVTLRSLIYLPSDNYSIRNSCEGNNQTITSINGTRDSVITPLPLGTDYDVSSLQSIFDLIESEQVCISTTADSTDFWWNSDKIWTEFENDNKSLICGMELCDSVNVDCS